MDLTDPQQWNPYSYANNTPISAADPTGLKTDCGTGGVHMPCTGNTGGTTGGGDDEDDKGDDTGNGGDNGGSSGGNNGAGSPSGNVAQAVPAVQQKEKCGWFAPVCNGWQRSMEWVHENQDTLGQIAIDLAEIELGLFAMEGGASLALSGGVVEVGSAGTASVVAVPAAALGVTIAVGGGAAAAHGAKNLGQHIDDDKVIWSPALRVGRIYVDLATSLSASTSVQHGMHAMASDYYEIDGEQFRRFYESVSSEFPVEHRVVRALLQGFLLTSLVLIDRMNLRTAHEMDATTTMAVSELSASMPML